MICQVMNGWWYGYVGMVCWEWAKMMVESVSADWYLAP